ncbi:hypothetical protein [Pseudoroseomonas cervicalis]|uniref:hypothetical protein n=1 Tax=Teichococcus cervicalis TaxID=204525 RepID=UPI00278078E4|nr:hypothetical protein [Pseudoroseomonas cervicalis]MDQ1079706.1 hypothetical protein [Pseudoroseomonas cervicalis]
MALTLTINGAKLSSAQFRTTAPAGAATPGEAFVTTEAIRDQLLATAAELRGISRPSGDRSRLRLLHTDMLERLWEEGRIREKQLEAGLEIRRVHAAIVGSGPGLAANTYGAPRGPLRPGDLPPGLTPAFANRFRPWREWAQQQRASRRSCVTLYDLTMAICVDNWGHEQLAVERKLDRRSVLRAVQVALHQYCLIGEWIEAA